MAAQLAFEQGYLRWHRSLQGEIPSMQLNIDFLHRQPIRLG
jgi:hypothetical protein